MLTLIVIACVLILLWMWKRFARSTNNQIDRWLTEIDHDHWTTRPDSYTPPQTDAKAKDYI